MELDYEQEREIDRLLELHDYQINREEAIVLLKRNERCTV